MSQPVKLSDDLVLNARLTGVVMERSIAGQVEYWARLGRSVEKLLNGRQVLELTKEKTAIPLSELIGLVGTPEGDRRVSRYIETLPFPHYAAHPDEAGLLIRTEEDGTTSVGRFVNRSFVVDSKLTVSPQSSTRKDQELSAR